MRILLVSHGYPPFGVAGVERMTEWTAAALSASGHDVTVLTRRPTMAPPLPRIERTKRDGVDVIAINGPPDFGRFPARQERLDRIFERVLLELMPDVVVLSHLITHSPRYVAVAHRWQVPVVIELHDFYTACERVHLHRPSGELCAGPEGGRACAEACFAEQDDSLRRWALRTLMFREAVGEADAVLAPSEFVASYFREHYRTRRPIVVIPNGVKCEDWAAPAQRASSDAPLHLASLGVVIPHKGPHVVLGALRLARLPRVRYTLFGPVVRPYARDLREQATHIEGLELRTYGPYDPEHVPMLLADVDALVIPSVVWETFSVVAREAMACGVPVIASRLGALPEAIREADNGMLFTAGAASELAALLRELDADRSRIERLRAGILSSDWISVTDRSRRLEQLLETVRAGGAPAAEPPSAQSELDSLRASLT
jgi:glycosyltransferase involved in cell wall biosynthesis